MKKTVGAILVFIIILMIATLFTGCNNEQANNKILLDAIQAIGNVDKIDTEWNEQSTVSYKGYGKMVMYEGNESIGVVYLGAKDLVLMEVSTRRTFLSDKLVVTKISIMYGCPELKRYVYVEFEDIVKDSVYKSDMTMKQWGDYLYELSINDVLDILMMYKLLDKY